MMNGPDGKQRFDHFVLAVVGAADATLCGFKLICALTIKWLIALGKVSVFYLIQDRQINTDEQQFWGE